MGCCCRHNGAIYLANITGGGEKRKYPLAIMRRRLSEVNPTRKVGVLYEIGCTLKNFIENVSENRECGLHLDVKLIFWVEL